MFILFSDFSALISLKYIVWDLTLTQVEPNFHLDTTSWFSRVLETIFTDNNKPFEDEYDMVYPVILWMID